MKKYILFLITTMCFGTLKAQPLYTENFNNYTIGNLGTDITGNIPGKGGWYTYSEGATAVNPPIGTNADYQIVDENSKGNVLKIQHSNAGYNFDNMVFRNDLKIYWQQRSSGNNVLKFAFDFYVDDYNGTGNGDAMIYIRNEKDRILFGYLLGLKSGFVSCHIADKPTTNSSERLKLANGQFLVLPKNTWFTFEMYVDYDNSNIYYSIPALNYTVVYPMTLLDPDGNAENDGMPEKLSLLNYKVGTTVANTLKFDNINISAQNTVPLVTVGINEVLSNSFNLYPNPATNIVTITNNANTQVQQITVYDVTGKLISTHTYSSETTLQLNVENLAAGAYTLHLATAEGTVVKKLIKK